MPILSEIKRSRVTQNELKMPKTQKKTQKSQKSFEINSISLYYAGGL
jgi:hypothetical protein